MKAFYICGGDTRPAAKRETDCPNALHDWPMPSGYVDWFDEANRRGARGWSNRKCPQCHLYGWAPGTNVKGTTAEHWQPQTVESPVRTHVAAPTESEER